MQTLCICNTPGPIPEPMPAILNSYTSSSWIGVASIGGVMDCAPIASIVVAGMAMERSRKRRILQRVIPTGVYGSARGPRLCFENRINLTRVNVSRNCSGTFIPLTERRSWVGLGGVSIWGSFLASGKCVLRVGPLLLLLHRLPYGPRMGNVYRSVWQNGVDLHLEQKSIKLVPCRVENATCCHLTIVSAVPSRAPSGACCS